jgi:hypothetical protein
MRSKSLKIEEKHEAKDRSFLDMLAILRRE